ncbi:MAG: glycosyltransferase family 25 protein [Desulfurococcaceae archaeon]
MVPQTTLTTSRRKLLSLKEVDGRKLTAEEYFRLVACSFLKDFLLMTPGEVGCALSHMKAYENLIHSGEEYALILEDDVIGNDKDIEKIHELIPELLNRYGNRFVWYVGGMEGLSKKYIHVKKTSI